MIYADKVYCTKPAQHAAAKRDAHLTAIMMNHMLAKNHDKDRWFSHLRMPYERIFFKHKPLECIIGMLPRINRSIYECRQFQSQAYLGA